jgi:hypothetical protein
MKYIGEFNELEKIGFAYAKDTYSKAHWWNDGRDHEQYDYYYYGDGKYTNALRIDGKTRLLTNSNPDNWNDEGDQTFLDIIYKLTKWSLIEIIHDTPREGE